jgi:hypothetical protein
MGERIKNPNKQNEMGEKAKGLNTPNDQIVSGEKMSEQQFIYTRGVDSGLVYPEEYGEAVEALEREGFMPIPLRRKYDPKEHRYFVKPDGTYEYVPAKKGEVPEAYALPKNLVEDKKTQLEATKKAETEAKVKAQQEKVAIAMEQARKTGKNVVLSSHVIPVGNKDVIVYKVVTPSGEIKTMEQIEA